MLFEVRLTQGWLRRDNLCLTWQPDTSFGVGTSFGVPVLGIIIIIIIIRNSYIAPNPIWLAQSTSQFKTRMDIKINTWNMHTPDDPTSTAKRRQTCTHPGTISATQTCNAAIHGPSKYLMIANHTKSITIIIYIKKRKRGSIGRFGRTSGFSTVT